MKKKITYLFISHFFFLIIGFGLGVYFLPILTAPASIEISKINEYENKSQYQTKFVRDLRGSDPFHWGEAKVTISNTKITVNGAIAPGPDYKLYLTNEDFLPIKDEAKYVAEVKSFEIIFKNKHSKLPVNFFIFYFFQCFSSNKIKFFLVTNCKVKTCLILIFFR